MESIQRLMDLLLLYVGITTDTNPFCSVLLSLVIIYKENTSNCSTLFYTFIRINSLYWNNDCLERKKSISRSLSYFLQILL